MNENEFWKLIEKAKDDSNGTCDIQGQLIVERLAEMEEEEIQDFDKQFRKLLDQAYSWHLWAAAIIIGCYCADDCFKDFRAWLIGQGKSVYYNALDNPETLVNFVEIPSNINEPVAMECEYLYYAATRAYETKTGNVWNVDHKSASSPRGTNKGLDEWLKLYPALAQKYWSRCDGDDV